MSKKSNRINILITAPFTSNGYDTFACVEICVRYSWTRLSSPEQEGKPPETPLHRFFWHTEYWERNQLPKPERLPAPGECKFPVQAMRDFVAELKTHWGDIHVQDNSGLLPDLHNGTFQ